MTNVPNPLTERLKEQVELLVALSAAFDRGDEVVALSIATAIRVLVHDTPRSTSLLTHLGRKTEIRFFSTARRTPGESVHLGLVRRINVGVHDGVGGEARYWALCDARYFPSLGAPPVPLQFDEWWEERIFATRDAWLTRMDLVLAVANKDGGAHFDTEVEVRYDAFRQSWSGGSTLVGINSGRERGYDNVPTRPALRQIAFEMIASLA